MIRILVVDDDKFARMGLISMMPWKKYGMEVVGEAANGGKALEFLSANQIDLVIADIAMPVMGGLELIRTVQQRYPTIHFVVLSFHEDFANVQEAFRLGVLDYISKDKMGNEDFGLIMQRIRDKLSATQEETEQSAAQLRKLEKLLEGVFWLYDNLQWDAVLQELAGYSYHVHGLERLIIEVFTRINNAVGIEIGKMPHMKEPAMAAEALTDYRTKFIAAMMRDTGSIYARLMLAAREVWQHFSQPISATGIADEIGFSRSYFSISFKKVLGITFSLFVRRERIRNAQQLLRETALPQSDIAYRIGYEDVKNFKNVFVEIANCTPSAYRRENTLPSGKNSMPEDGD